MATIKAPKKPLATPTPMHLTRIKLDQGRVFVTHMKTRIQSIVERWPLQTFFSLLFLLILVIALGNYVRKPEDIEQTKKQPKLVSTYAVGSAPTVSMQAEIQKSGVITVTSLTGGIVNAIHVSEGKSVTRGAWIVGLSSTHQGGNTYAVSRQIAEKQSRFSEENYPIQKELIAKQKSLAYENRDNVERLREITDQSIGDTQSAIDLNSDIIRTLDTNLSVLTASPSGNESLILSTKQLKSQFLSANNQLNSAIRNARYQADSANPPTDLATIQKDLTLKQLELQEKSLELNLEVSKLQLSLARIAEGLMYPSSPISGRVERIFVRTGQAVAPGTPIALISGSANQQATAVVYAPESIAHNISKTEPTKILLGKDIITALPAYVSSEAVQGSLYSIIYPLPEATYDQITDKSYVAAIIPVGYPDTGSTIPYIPLTAVYQTRESAYAFVASDGKAKSVKITLGDVYGRFVEVTNGLPKGSSVILDRTVVAGDAIQIKQ